MCISNISLSFPSSSPILLIERSYHRCFPLIRNPDRNHLVGVGVGVVAVFLHCRIDALAHILENLLGVVLDPTGSHQRRGVEWQKKKNRIKNRSHSHASCLIYYRETPNSARSGKPAFAQTQLRRIAHKRAFTRTKIVIYSSIHPSIHPSLRSITADDQ